MNDLKSVLFSSFWNVIRDLKQLYVLMNVRQFCRSPNTLKLLASWLMEFSTWSDETLILAFLALA